MFADRSSNAKAPCESAQLNLRSKLATLLTRVRRLQMLRERFSCANQPASDRFSPMKAPLLLCLLATGLCAHLSAADITAEKTGTVIHFAVDGKTICDYQMEPGKVPEGVDAVFAHGAHLHPIYSPSGKLVTGNHPEDHRWHRGVWMAWTKTEFGDSHPDFWNMGKVGEKLAAEVRFEALHALVASGRNYSVEQAKEVLVSKRATTTARGFLAMSQTDLDGEAVLERYAKQYFDGLSIAQLEEKAQSAIFDQNAYFALVRRDFGLRGDDLRKAVANEFVDRFELLLQEMARQYGAQTELIEKTRSLAQHLRSRFTREGLDIICSRFDPTDLSLIRSKLESDDVNYSATDLRYLAKFGQWRDIPLVIASIERPEYGRKYASLLSTASSTKYADAAHTLYALGKHRLADLLATPMPAHLLAHIILLMPEKVFQGLDDAVIHPLMRSEDENVRKWAALKFVRAFPRRKVKQFLDEYLAANQFYYNVIHWLDFGLSVPRRRMLRAAVKVLTEAKS